MAAWADGEDDPRRVRPGGDWPPADAFADQAFATAADAYARTPESWERAVHAAIVALFEFLVQRPAETSACIIGEHGATRSALARRDRLVGRFTELLQPGFAVARTPPPPVVAEAIAGGIYEMVRGYVLDRRIDELPDAVPHATIVALAPFIGTDGAMRLAGYRHIHAGG
jgi:hypothetical protein